MFKGTMFLQSEKDILTLDEFIQHIEYLKNNIFHTNNIWFRGHESKSYKLIPSVYRNINYKIENEKKLRDEFLDKAKGFINNLHYDEIEWYFLMQHFGLKTRLLDWTEGYLFALYFALKSEKLLEDPCVWVINPEELNNISISKNYVLRTSEKIDKETINEYLDYVNFKEENPIAISPTYSNERILRQKGVFTLHSGKQSINSIYQRANNKNIIRINISRKARTKILYQLKMSGISESSIFPDLEGLSRELNEKYEF